MKTKWLLLLHLAIKNLNQENSGVVNRIKVFKQYQRTWKQANYFKIIQIHKGKSKSKIQCNNYLSKEALMNTQQKIRAQCSYFRNIFKVQLFKL